MFGFGRTIEAARKDRPSTARRRSGGTLRKAEYERRRKARLQAKEQKPRTREAEAARVAHEYRVRRNSRVKSSLPVIAVIAVVIVVVAALVIHGCTIPQ